MGNIGTRYIYDDYKNRVGKIEGDTIYDDYGKIKAYIIDNKIVDSRLYGKILYQIHEDGDITEGTSRKIVARVTKDGYILEGTSRWIAGKVDMPKIPVPAAGGSDISESGSSDGAWMIALFGIFFLGFCLYFAIFLMPGVVADKFAEQIEKKDWSELASLGTTVLASIVSNFIANKMMGKAEVKFLDRIVKSFKVSWIAGVLVMCFCIFAIWEYSFGMVLGAFLISALFAVWPTMFFSVLFWLIYKIKKK